MVSVPSGNASAGGQGWTHRSHPNGQVLRLDGTVIANLYAGGGTAVGLSGDTAGGHMSGNGLLSAYSMGMIIGQHLVKSLRER